MQHLTPHTTHKTQHHTQGSQATTHIHPHLTHIQTVPAFKTASAPPRRTHRNHTLHHLFMPCLRFHALSRPFATLSASHRVPCVCNAAPAPPQPKNKCVQVASCGRASRCQSVSQSDGGARRRRQNCRPHTEWAAAEGQETWQ